jgi:hypothetical protein
VISRPVLVHYHIFKNAGTSVDFALQRSFGSRWATFEGRHAFDLQTSEQLGQFLQSRPEVCAVSSHLARPPLPGSECRPIVFLRHPLLRVRSVQEFIRRNPDQPGCPVTERETLSKFVKWALGSGREEGGGVVCNYQVVHLSNASWRTHVLKAKATAQDLDEAKSLIVSWGIVGIVEHYKKSTRRFQAAYAQQFPDLDFVDVRANRTSAGIPDVESQTREIRDELGSELFERLAEANQLDIELYHRAVSRFENAIATHDDRGLSNPSASMRESVDIGQAANITASAEELDVEKLRDELRYLATDWEALVRNRDELISQRDALIRVRESEIVEHEAFACRHNDLITQHEVLAHAHNDLSAVHAELARALDAEVAEHQALALAHNDLCATHAELARVHVTEVAKLDTLARAYSSLVAEHDTLAHYSGDVVVQRDALLASRSWRLTAPLRWIRKLFS